MSIKKSLVYLISSFIVISTLLEARKPHTQSKLQVKPYSQVKLKPHVRPRPQIKPKPQTQSRPQVKPQPHIKPRPQEESQSQIEPRPPLQTQKQTIDSRVLKSTDKEIVLRLYQIMKDIHELFTWQQIPYWVDGGTLIGVVRHKGLIRWDEDLDIDIDVAFEGQLLSLTPLLDALNYEIIETWFGYKIYPRDGFIIPGFDHLFPFIDIFITEMQDDKVFYALPKEKPSVWGKRAGMPIFIKKDELYPLKEYPFGEIQVLGAQNPLPFLDHMYDDWNTIAAVWYDHSKEKWTGITKVQLYEGDRIPATPTGPLEDRVGPLLAGITISKGTP